MALWGNIEHDSRVKKEAQTLSRAGYDVTIVTNKTNFSKETCSKLEPKIKIKRFPYLLRTKNQPKQSRSLIPKILAITSILIGQLKLTYALYSEKPSILHAHDINTLVPATIVRLILGCQLIYDAHEYTPDRLGYRKIRWLTTKIEGLIAPRIDGMITVSHPIARAYSKLYRLKGIVVLENFPTISNKRLKLDKNKVRRQWKIPRNNIVILYQGGLNPGRGLFCLLDAMKFVDPNGYLVMIGNGSLKNKLKEYAQYLRISDRVTILDAVPSSMLHNYTKAADIGVHTLDDSCLNHKWASPNKLFEYIHAELPIVMSDLTEPRNIINRYQVGLCFAPNSPEDLAFALNSLIQNSDLRNTFKNSCRNAVKSLNWSKQEHKLTSLYQKLCF